MPTPSGEVQSGQLDFAKEEERILAYWREIDAFQTQLKLSEGRPEFSFYDGPPFATGLPHYGNLLVGTIKDIVTRHASASGYHVIRRFGWDTHGVPVEQEIDKDLNIKSKADVYALPATETSTGGISTYNEKCRAIVMRYASEWRTTVERTGRWIDFDNDYKTLDTPFMESVWWAFGQLYEKGQVYRGRKVMPYSTGLTTPLSNFEAELAFDNIRDPAIVVAFTLKDDPKTSLLAWTTTPWTLPSNLALCVNPEFRYIKVYDEERGHNFILFEELLKIVYGDDRKEAKKEDSDAKDDKQRYRKVGEYTGKEMLGWRYVPLFNYFTDRFKDTAFRVLNDSYVSNKEGTGIVHQAPGFGEDDYRVCLAHGVLEVDDEPPCPLDDVGKFVNEVPDFEGQYFKKVDKEVIGLLKARGHIIVHSSIVHKYPLCYRSKTPLLFRVMPVWFVRVKPIVDQLAENNLTTTWVPENVQTGRFGNWLKNARDWNISRNRYWGTPIPLWVSEDMQEIKCISSVKQLEELSGVKGITDLHRDKIDHITIPSETGRGVLKRVEEVFDCWFESGSMPYAQVHYPFENKERFDSSFPAHFICEGIDQTRGWFYTLLVLATHLFGKAPWRNLIATGLVLAADGKKMSKSLKNYPDPNEILNKYGADATRMFLVNSSVTQGENLLFREEGVRDIIARVLRPWHNSLQFFLQQVAVHKKTGLIPEFVYEARVKRSENIMDRWILAKCQSLIELVNKEMAAYRLYTVVTRLLDLVDELTNWYIRFNRRRLKGEDGREDTVQALNTLFETLFTLCRTMSSFTPFLTESIYQQLRVFIPDSPNEDTRSIHFLGFPEVKEEYFDTVIERQVKRMQTIIEQTRAIRDRKMLAFKVPLKELIVFHPDKEYLDDVRPLQRYIESELNVIDVKFTSDESKAGVRYSAVADWPVLGRKLRKDIGRVKAGLTKVTSDEVKKYLETGKITVDGIELVAGDLAVRRSAGQLEVGESSKYDTNTDNDVVVLLDVTKYKELEGETLARELINRIQKLRKKAGLQATDDVEIYYKFENGVGQDLLDAMKSHGDFIRKTVRAVPKDISERGAGGKELINEEQEILETKFDLTIVKD
ncbi:isoleucine-tRNA ligase [Schizopora paradoxa]|uniref:Isoleucine--tRNA ligase, cytoplasmic n=1 Tax=Schizopora paradoxa TaxID=27342 RepID=A0A0H2S5R3_9AGAM|nr:isoleucine-tRNA ligase [Schizopora paradoxa]